MTEDTPTYTDVHPTELTGAVIRNVDTTTYDYDNGYEDVVLTLADGRTIRFSSCSCCGGMTVMEA